MIPQSGAVLLTVAMIRKHTRKLRFPEKWSNNYKLKAATSDRIMISERNRKLTLLYTVKRNRGRKSQINKPGFEG